MVLKEEKCPASAFVSRLFHTEKNPPPIASVAEMETVESRKFEDIIIAALKMESISAIGICEFGSTGEKIGKMANGAKLFDEVEIVSVVGGRFPDEMLSGIIRKERILIILADVPEMFDFQNNNNNNNIGILLQQLCVTSKIIITSRFSRVFSEQLRGAAKIFTGRGLEMAELWILLRPRVASLHLHPLARLPLDPYVVDRMLKDESKLWLGGVVEKCPNALQIKDETTEDVFSMERHADEKMSHKIDSLPTDHIDLNFQGNNDDGGGDKHLSVHHSLPSSSQYQPISEVEKVTEEEVVRGTQASEGKEVEINHKANFEIYLGCDDYVGSCIGELKDMNNLKGSLFIANLQNVTTKDEAAEACLCNKEGLTKIQLQWNVLGHEKIPGQEEVVESLQPPLGIKELQMFNYSGGVLPSWLSSTSFSELVRISLCCCRFLDSLPSLGELPSLKFLEITRNEEIVEINTSFCRKHTNRLQLAFPFFSDKQRKRVAFPKLEELSFSSMSKLEKLTGWENGDFPCLSVLAIRYCPKLVGLPNLSHLNSLSCLWIGNCPELSCLPKGGLPSALRSLSIQNCAVVEERLCNEQCEDWSVFAHVPTVFIYSRGMIVLNRCG